MEERGLGSGREWLGKKRDHPRWRKEKESFHMMAAIEEKRNSFKWKGREREGKSYMKDKSERDLVLKSLLLVSLDLSTSLLIQ